MSSKPAAMPLFPDAYLADTTHLTAEQHGVYLLLLMAAWRTDDCSLPDDDKRLARSAKLSPHKWRGMRETILEFWTLSNGRWTQKRQLRERAFVEERSRQAREAADTRWGRSPGQAEPGDQRFSRIGPKIPEQKGPQKPDAPFDAQPIENTQTDECGRISGGTCETDAPPPPPHRDTSPSERTRARGRMGNKRKRKSAPLPANWQPDAGDAHMAAIIAGWPPDRVERELAQFRDHAAANDRRLVDWQAGFRAWLRNARDLNAQRESGRGLFDASR